MNKNDWIKNFTETSNFNWPCPNCNSKALKFLKDKFVSEETQDSLKFRSENEHWEVEWIEYNISGQLKCINCKEIIFFLGKGNPQESDFYDQHSNSYLRDYEIYFRPTYINPLINLFDIPYKCPDNLKAEIVDSFKLFWCDLESCANKIRSSLEVLMNEFKVKKYTNKNGKRNLIPLHIRIENFPKKEIVTILMAIKWIGNIGSHKSNKLKVIDIVETYYLLEHALNVLYLNNEEEIQKIAKEINSTLR